MRFIEKYLEQIKELHSKGMRNAEISRELGIDSRRISEGVKILGLKSNTRKFNETPTPEEEVVLYSLFIGDGCIYKSKGNVNYRVNLAHSLKQEQYFMKKYEIIKNFLQSDYFYESQKHKNGETYSCIKVQSKVNPYFNKMREKFYNAEGKKVIPKDIAEFLTPELLAYKYFDDGYLHRGFAIAMDDYSDECIETFAGALLKNFGFETTLWKNGKNIYIPAEYRDQFIGLVKEFATDDVLYKLGEFGETPNE